MIIDEKSIFDVFNFESSDLTKDIFTIRWSSDFDNKNNFKNACEMFKYLSGMTVLQVLNNYDSSKLEEILHWNCLVGASISAFFDIKNPENINIQISLSWKSIHVDYNFNFGSVSLFRCQEKIKQHALERFHEIHR